MREKETKSGRKILLWKLNIEILLELRFSTLLRLISRMTLLLPPFSIPGQPFHLEQFTEKLESEAALV